MYGCRVDWSTGEENTQLLTARLSQRFKPFEVSCLVAGDLGCIGGSRRGTGVFVILLAVGSTGGAAV